MVALSTETPQINASIGLKWKSNSAPKCNVDFSAFFWREIQFNKVRSKVWGEHKNVSVILCSIYLLLAYLFSSKNCNFLCLWSCCLKELMLHRRNFNFKFLNFYYGLSYLYRLYRGRLPSITSSTMHCGLDFTRQTTYQRILR